MDGHQSKPWRFKTFHSNRQELAVQMIIERNVRKVRKKIPQSDFFYSIILGKKDYNYFEKETKIAISQN